MRFRHRERPERASIRQQREAAMDPVEAEVFRDSLPGSKVFPSGIIVGDSDEPPAQVTGTLASAGLRTVLVEWDRLDGFQTVDGAGGYEVELDIVNTFDDSPRTQRTSATMASFTDLDPDTEYFVRVRGVQGEDNAGTWGSTVSATTALADTGDLQASAVTADKIAANAVTASKLAAITMEVGKYLQSDNYDGTDVATGDATQGFRVEAGGNAEFRDVRVRGDMRASTLLSTSGDDNLIENWSFEDPDLSGWSVTGGVLSRVTYAPTPMGSYVLQYENNTGVSQYPELKYLTITGLVPGAAYYVAIAGARDQVEPETYYADLHVDWYDDTNTLISTDTVFEERIAGHDFFTVLGGHDNPVFAPDNVSYAEVRIEFTAFGDSVPNGKVVYFDGFYFAPFTYFKGAYLEGAASIELTRHYDDRSPASKFQPGYWYIHVPRVFEDDFNSVPAIFSDVGDYGADNRESVVGLYTGRPELTGGGNGARANIFLASGWQDGSKGSTIDLNANEVSYEGSRFYPGYVLRARRATVDQSLPSGTTTAKFNFVDEDSDSGYDTGTGEYTVPVDGYYMVTASLRIKGGAGGTYRQGVIRLNGSSAIMINRLEAFGATSFIPLAVSDRFDAGDRISVDVSHDDAGGLDLDIVGHQSSIRVVRLLV